MTIVIGVSANLQGMPPANACMANGQNSVHPAHPSGRLRRSFGG